VAAIVRKCVYDPRLIKARLRQVVTLLKKRLGALDVFGF